MVIQVNLGSKDHPEIIFISESLSLTEKEGLMVLVKEYIDVFAWNYKDMPGLDSQIVVHHLNIKPDAKQLSNNNVDFARTLWKLLKPKSINSLHVASYGTNNIQIGLLILFPFLRRWKNTNLY